MSIVKTSAIFCCILQINRFMVLTNCLNDLDLRKSATCMKYHNFNDFIIYSNFMRSVPFLTTAPGYRKRKIWVIELGFVAHYVPMNTI